MLASTDLLAPRGEIEPALFPMDLGQALADRLDGYLTEGYAAVTDAGITDDVRADRVAQAYAYARAYDAVLQRIIANPTTASFNDKGSTSYSAEQLRILRDTAARWRTQYEQLIAVPITSSQPLGISTGATVSRFYF